MRTARRGSKARVCALIAAAGLVAAAPSLPAQSMDELSRMQTFLGIMTDYMAIIETTHEISAEPEKAAILQMQKMKEIYEERGEKARVVEELRRVLENSRNQAIRNAAYVLMSDTLKETGRSAEAIELLRQGLAENLKAAE
jgi:hypothetical protein